MLMIPNNLLLYIAFRKDNCLITVSKMELLINDIRSWMTHNKLKLNYDKSKIIIVLNGARRPDIKPTEAVSSDTQPVVQSV